MDHQISDKGRPIRRFRTHQEKGAISIAFALGVIILLFVIAVTSLSYIGTDTRSASNFLTKSKAFYAAEAGLELALGDLKNKGTGEFANVTIGDATVTTTVTDDTLLDVTATADGISKSLQVVVNTQEGVLPDAFYYSVASFNTGKKLKFEGGHYGYLDGDIFTYNAIEVEFEDNYTLSNPTVHVEEGTYIDNQTSYSYTLDEFSSGSNPVAWPTLDTQYYDDYINNVGGYQSRSGDLEGANINLSNYPDNVYYCNNSIYMEEDCNITGPGVVVSSNSIYITENTQIGPDVHIISGNNLFLSGGSDVTGMGSIVYGDNKVDIGSSYTSVEGAIISPAFVDINCVSSFSSRGIMTGIIYSADKAKISHTRIHGSVVVDYIVTEDVHCTGVKFLESYLPTTAPPGFSGGSGTVVTVVNGTWKVQ